MVDHSILTKDTIMVGIVVINDHKRLVRPKNGGRKFQVKLNSNVTKLRMLRLVALVY